MKQAMFQCGVCGLFTAVYSCVNYDMEDGECRLRLIADIPACRCGHYAWVMIKDSDEGGV